jgi:hypothetical protein
MPSIGLPLGGTALSMGFVLVSGSVLASGSPVDESLPGVELSDPGVGVGDELSLLEHA